MSRYDWEKVEELRWSLIHYYSPHHFVLYHENNLEKNKYIHLSQTKSGILLHLGWAVKDIVDAVGKYHEELKTDNKLKIKLWRYYNEQLPIMPVEVKNIISQPSVQSMMTGTSTQSISASGTATFYTAPFNK